MYQDRLRTLIEAQDNRVRGRQRRLRSDPLFFPIELTGGIGDAICSLDAIRELSKQYQVLVYSKHADAFNYFNAPVKALDGPIPDFVWHLEMSSISRFKFSDEFDGFEVPSHRELFQNQLALRQEFPTFGYLLDRHPNEDAAMARFARTIEVGRNDMPLYSLGIAPLTQVSFSRTHEPLKIITIHDGYDTSNWSGIDGRATKQWKWSHWCDLAKRIRREFPDYKLFQLGAITGREIDGVDVSLLNKTTILEAFDFLARSALHIDGDSGLVHAATHLGVPCVVMFGPTPDYFYGYPQNMNIRAKTCADACYWLDKDWMAHCPIGYKTPQCMDDIGPDQVFEAVRERLKLA